MNQSERKLRRILGINRPWYFRFIDFYLERPTVSDLIVSALIIVTNTFLVKKNLHFFNFDKDAIPDILNELVSSSLSAGGFVLAALAIIAGIKQAVPEIAKSEKPKNGKEYFYNNIGYSKVIRLYGIACVVFLIGFIYFSLLRGIYSSINEFLFLNLVIGGVSFISFTFLRCILVLWSVIRIK